nr:hypothetical protein HmN_000226200 [Hymenolepis microstoma]
MVTTRHLRKADPKVHYNNPNPNPSGENHGDCPVVKLLRQHLGRIFMAQKSVMLCVWRVDQLGIIYYELLKPYDETILGEHCDRYRRQLMPLSSAQEKRQTATVQRETA